MALSDWQFTANVVTITAIIITLIYRWIESEVFPWHMLRKQKLAVLSPPTKSFAGKTVLITGANGAFGSRAAKMIAHLGVETLILADVRDCGDVKRDIEAEMGKKGPDVRVWHVDMMDYKSCKEFAEKAKQLKSLDGVLLAAGILSFKRKESPEGWETSTYLTPILVISNWGQVLTYVI